MTRYRLARGTISKDTTTTTTKTSTTTTASGSSSSSTTNSVLSTTTTSSSNAARKVIESENDNKFIRLKMNDLKEQYQEDLHQSMPGFVYRMVESALLHNVPYEYFVYALHEASTAPRPSWKYAEAIVRRCVREQPDPYYLFGFGIEEG